MNVGNFLAEMRNIEIKARVKEITKILETSERLSGTQGVLIKQHDTFYHVNHGRFKLRRFEDGSAELIFYERPDIEGPKISTYQKFAVPARSEDLHGVLEIACGIAETVKKTRHLFMVGQTRIHVDSVENLGDFIELEVVLESEQKPEEGEQIALDLMNKLGVDKEDLLTGSYADMLRSKVVSQ